MRTVHEVQELTGVSIRTLRYYDKIGLLPASAHTEAGYRLYDEEALSKLSQILLYRELGFALEDIKEMMEDPHFDRQKALGQQLELLLLKKARLEALIDLTRRMQEKGVTALDFSVFDNQQMEEYARQAKEAWGETEAYQEYTQKAAGRSREEDRVLGGEMMDIFARLGKVRDLSPQDSAVQELVRELQAFISEHYYQCSKDILYSLGLAYGAGGDFTKNIDRAGGEGTGVFAREAIRVYCGKEG